MSTRSKNSRNQVQLIHADKTVPTKSNSQQTLAGVLQEECPNLANGARFVPSPLVPGPHAQTIYAFLAYYVYYAESIMFPKFTRELFKLPDGGTLALDWARCNNYTERPVVVIISGVTGTSNDFYVRRCYAALIKLDYSVVVVHSRGCGGSKLTSPMPFHCGYTGDYREVVAHLHTRPPKLQAAGARVLSGCKHSCKPIAVGNPYNLYKVVVHLDSQFILHPSKVYGVAILNFLKTAFATNKQQILEAPIKLDEDRIRCAATLVEFTEAMTRRVYGYPSAKALLEDSNSGDFLHNIQIPMLFLNSLDDPICANPHIVLGLTEHGGHIGYMGRTWPTSWIELPVAQFFQCALKHYG
ncbi:AB-hydrolase YheT [Linderina pennispora]|uniref:AB-hydrolase YheT n=1 Tax=Linderina pennispora TaxID=61395 RepID=A0A1Y1WKZ6_9FUNG|nr:AB-hydrolase YheT [Linderina pennispora]ORX73876.1 AB-hydrolase YheT [Linderina pennispora]